MAGPTTLRPSSPSTFPQLRALCEIVFDLLQNGAGSLLGDVRSCPCIPTKDKSLQNQCSFQSEDSFEEFGFCDCL